MRVLLLNFEKGWRGGERQTLLTALGLQQHGFDVAVLARKEAPLAQRLKEAGIPVIEQSSSWRAIWFLLSAGRHYDVYHAQTSAALTWLASLKKCLKGKIVFTRRTAFPLAGNHAAITSCSDKRLKRLRWKWLQADDFVAISQAAAADPKALGIQPYLIPSAIEFVPADTDHIIDFTEQHQLGGRYVLGTVAALSPEKDPLTTIRAVHALWQKRQDFVFLHFGADGDSSAEAKTLVQELGLQDVYLFMGFQRRIEDMYRLFHVFVLSSRFEALGTSVLDAFMYAAPAVVTKTGGLTELIAEGRGVGCTVGDFEAIANACDRILDDEPYRNKMILDALNWVQEEHSVEMMVQRYAQLYKGELEKPDSETVINETAGDDSSSAEPVNKDTVEHVFSDWQPSEEHRQEPIIISVNEADLAPQTTVKSKPE